MMFRSLGLRSDALAMRGVSQFEACAIGVVMRTPSEPNYWCGNAVIRQENAVQPDDDIAAFCTAFPSAKHRKILWDTPSPDPAVMRAAYPVDFEVGSYDVLTCQGAASIRPVPDGIVLRSLEADSDWCASSELAREVAAEQGYPPETHTPFQERRIATHRVQIAAGLGAWFGAFDGSRLVAQMGMLHDAEIARFQSVETRATHRRLGICAALLSHVSSWAAVRAPSAVQVIVAEADSSAGGLYRRQGFVHEETLVEATRRGY